MHARLDEFALSMPLALWILLNSVRISVWLVAAPSLPKVHPMKCILFANMFYVHLKRGKHTQLIVLILSHHYVVYTKQLSLRNGKCCGGHVFSTTDSSLYSSSPHWSSPMSINGCNWCLQPGVNYIVFMFHPTSEPVLLWSWPLRDFNKEMLLKKRKSLCWHWEQVRLTLSILSL